MQPLIRSLLPGRGYSQLALYALSLVLPVLSISCSEDAAQGSGRVAELVGEQRTALTVPGAPTGSIVLEGMIDAHHYLEVSFARSGTVLELGAAVGDRVQRGQLLGMLESESLNEKLLVARSQRARARRALPATRLSRNGPPPAYLDRSARARRSQISPQVSMQDADLQRLKRAVQEGGQKEATRVALSILEQRNRKPSSRTAERLARDRHTERLYEDLVDKVQVLEESIKASRLLSPIEGVVVEVNAFVGDTWNPRSQVSTYRLMDNRRLVVWILAPEEVALRAQSSGLVLVRLPNVEGTPGPVVRAKVDEISVVQIEGVSDEGVLELLRQIRIALPSDVSSGLEVGDEALVAFPP